ncbi:MAG: hypothetical protein ABIF77_05165 [bacterium]
MNIVRLAFLTLLLTGAGCLVGCSESDPTGTSPGSTDDTTTQFENSDLPLALDMTEDLLVVEEDMTETFGPDQGLGRGESERGRRGMGSHGFRLPAFLRALELTEERMAQIREYLAEVRGNLPQNPPTDPQERRELRRELHADFLEFLESILTEEQLATLTELREAHQQQIRDRRQDHMARRAERVVAFLTEALTLDADQVSQLETLLAEAQEAALTIMDARMAGELTPEEARAAMAEIRDTLRDGISAMLTEEQLAIFEELLGRHHL